MPPSYKVWSSIARLSVTAAQSSEAISLVVGAKSSCCPTDFVLCSWSTGDTISSTEGKSTLHASSYRSPFYLVGLNDFFLKNPYMWWSGWGNVAWVSLIKGTQPWFSIHNVSHGWPQYGEFQLVPSATSFTGNLLCWKIVFGKRVVMRKISQHPGFVFFGMKRI